MPCFPTGTSGAIRVSHQVNDLWDSLQTWASLVAQLVKNLLAFQETWVQSPGQEDPLEKEMAIHSSNLA